MSEDIHLQDLNFLNKCTEIFSCKFKKIFNNEGIHTDDGAICVAEKLAVEIATALTCLSLGDLQAIGDMRSGLTGLASQFVRALAVEAARPCLTKNDGGAGKLAVASTTDISSQSQCRGDLESMVIEDWAGRVAGATYLEENLRIPRSTLHRWHRRNEVVALRKGRQRHVFPLAQFVDGRPASGIPEVLSYISHPRLAWFWMLHPSPLLNGRVPIELLRQDMVGDVVSAAREYSRTS